MKKPKKQYIIRLVGYESCKKKTHYDNQRGGKAKQILMMFCAGASSCYVKKYTDSDGNYQGNFLHANKYEVRI